ncbi:MAG: bis-aminopropyl spermidine synthase family protein [Myxococcota bacterium]
MNEGDYRVLHALGHGQEVSRTEAVRASGEAHSVLTDLAKRKAKWFDAAGKRFRLSEKGRAALAYETRERTPKLGEADHLDALEGRVRLRPQVQRELDQVHAALPSVVRRARLLFERGEAQRGIAFLGDDDLTALAVAILLEAAESERRLRVFDVDREIVHFYGEVAHVDAVHHDLREPLESRYWGAFGAVHSDPPYASEGFALFANRAAELLKPDGHYYVHYGYSRRSRERGLAKQAILVERGWLLEAIHPDFSEYEGAESIGSRSALIVAAITPRTRAIEIGEEDDLYTRRTP